jgi:hypothetical protein
LQSDGTWSSAGARLVRATTDECLHAGLAHMDMLADVRRRGLDTDFAGEPLQGRRQDADAPPEAAATRAPEKKLGATAADQPPANIDPDDVPF